MLKQEEILKEKLLQKERAKKQKEWLEQQLQKQKQIQDKIDKLKQEQEEKKRKKKMQEEVEFKEDQIRLQVEKEQRQISMEMFRRRRLEKIQEDEENYDRNYEIVKNFSNNNSSISDTIIISPMSADLERNTDTFGKMDVYCKVIIGKQSQQTDEAKGTNPQWDGQDLEFQINKANDPLVKIEIWDSDFGSDDIVGKGSFQVSEAMSNNSDTLTVQLQYKKKSVGECTLMVAFA